MRIALAMVVCLVILGNNESRAAEILRAEGKLAPDDPKDSVKAWSKSHEARLRAGVAYDILLNCEGLDSFFRVADESGKELARGGGISGGRIAFSPSQDGLYRIIVFMPLYRAGTNKYSLVVSSTLTRIEDQITADDDNDPAVKNSRLKKHDIKLKEGVTYTILKSSRSEVNLRLEDTGGKELGAVPFYLGKAIVFKCPATSTYRVVASGSPVKMPVRYQWALGEVQSRTERTMTRDDTPNSLRRNEPCKIHEIKLEAGMEYEIRMDSKELDSFLRLENSNGIIMAEDDDAGGFPNALIRFKPAKDDTFRVVATTRFFANKPGAYVLTIRTKP